MMASHIGCRNKKIQLFALSTIALPVVHYAGENTVFKSLFIAEGEKLYVVQIKVLDVKIKNFKAKT